MVRISKILLSLCVCILGSRFSFEEIGTIEVYEGKIGFIEIFPSDFGYKIRSLLKKNSVLY